MTPPCVPAYSNLSPVVAVLEAAGNLAIDGGFLNSPAGWYCRMRDPLDIELVQSSLEVSSMWDMSVSTDTILDRSSWSAVLGPGADGYG